MVSAIIVAAGSSRRMGFDKLSAILGGTSVLSRSVQAFIDCPDIEEVICVCDENRFNSLTIDPKGKILKRADGGTERHLSVHSGLQEVGRCAELIAVHDGARPLIAISQISKCIDAARQHKAASCARRITETMKRSDSHNQTVENINRENAWLMETPQCFERKLLDKSYQNILQNDLLVTDEVSAVEHLGSSTFLVSNPLPNPKITFAHDLPLAEHLLTFTGK